MRALSERTFRPLFGGGACCGADIGVASAPGLPYGSYVTPSVVSPGVVSPSVVSPSVVAPSTGPSSSGTITTPSDTSPQLEPIPSAAPGAAPANSDVTPSQGAKSSTGKANYEAYRSNLGNASASTLSTSPVPTTRSAQGALASTSSTLPADAESALDNLPPLDLPTDVAHAASTTPPAPAPPDGESNVAAKSVAPSASNAVMKKFAGVEAKISAGSLPEKAGLAWLADKGYKTVLDLREEADSTPAFRDEIARLGMRYVALPVNAKTLDADHVRRFEKEITQAERVRSTFSTPMARAAGALWYIHRVAVDRVDTPTARRDAEEIGLTDPSYLSAADAYLSQQTPASKPAPAPTSGANAPTAPSAGPSPVASLNAA